MRILRDLTLFVAAVALLAASVFAYRAEQFGRRSADELVTRFSLDLRRPAEVEAMTMQPAADLRAVFVAEMTLADIYERVLLGQLEPDVRSAWIRSLTQLGDQLAASGDLELDALSHRPGWSFHQSYLGQLVYLSDRRVSFDKVLAERHKWETPLRAAIDAAPGRPGSAAFLAAAYLETWGLTPPAPDQAAVFRGALRKQAFVERNYESVGAVFGRERTIELLPDSEPILRTAFAYERRAGRIETASVLRGRIDRMEWGARLAKVNEIETFAVRGDRFGQEQACEAFAAAFRLEELDGPEARRQAARVLELWPSSERGSWLRDPRAKLVRYFLAGREADVTPASLAAVVTSLSDVPPTVSALVDALNGKTGTAEQSFLASETRGSFEWTPLIVALAREYARSGRKDRARRILDQLAPTAREECNVLLAKRAVESDELAKAEIGVLLDATRPDTFPLGAWSRNGSLSLCIDPLQDRNARLVVLLHASKPSLVAYGWDGGRVKSVLVKDDISLVVPLQKMAGRHAFSVVTEAGERVAIVETRIER